MAATVTVAASYTTSGSTTPLSEQCHWYSSVLRGHYGYFGLQHN
jgi:hypothetical protein